MGEVARDRASCSSRDLVGSHRVNARAFTVLERETGLRLFVLRLCDTLDLGETFLEVFVELTPVTVGVDLYVSVEAT